jgi:hypothetical protein
MGGTITDQQVRRLMEEMNKKQNKSFAAMKAGMNRRTAAKYLELGKLPSELPPVERTWRTRENPFEQHWPEVEQWLKNAPELEAKFLFDHLCEEYPGHYQEGQLRTLQRYIKHWRATQGPDKEVFFSQQHHPGQLMQTDFTHMNSLRVTINGEEFKHMFCHCVLTYSNWEWGRICFSESYEAVKLGVQSTLVKLGRVPFRHRTDGTTAATHRVEKDKNGKRGFNEEYKNMMDHFAMTPETVNDPNHNADVEASHNVLKKRINQHLLFRGSRDFESRRDYEQFLFGIMEKANTLRSKRLEEELAVMKELPVNCLPLYTESEEKVRPSSTIKVKKNVYSVPSRLIGERVIVRVYEDKVHVLYAGKPQLEVERLKGSGGKCINYRHIIWSLMNKPGAFENYQYRQELFPTIHFRQAFDALRGWYSPFNANKEYLRILHVAATTMESEVETALILLMETGTMFSSAHVKQLIGTKKPTVPMMKSPRVNLTEYNVLLQAKGGHYEK